MPIKVYLEGSRNDQIEYLGDPQDVLGRLLPQEFDPSLPYLSGIDPYDDTVFNEMQLKVVLKEWQSLLDSAESDNDRSFLLQVQKLAEKAIEDRLYLRFVGD